MASEIILIPKDDDGERILDQFEERTGLEPELGDEDERVYPIEGDDHRIEIVETLDDINTDWTKHLALGQPS